MNFKIAALIAAAVVASSLPVATASAGTLPLVTRANEDTEIWRSKKNVFVLEIDKGFSTGAGNVPERLHQIMLVAGT